MKGTAGLAGVNLAFSVINELEAGLPDWHLIAESLIAT